MIEERMFQREGERAQVGRSHGRRHEDDRVFRGQAALRRRHAERFLVRRRVHERREERRREGAIGQREA